MREAGTRSTLSAQRRYDRQAGTYDLREAPLELLFRRWRRRIWSLVPEGGHVLEIGVGTGKNLPFYPQRTDLFAFDLSPKMLAKARRQAALQTVDADLALMDAQSLGLAEASFDVAIATFVFCSVPDALRGLEEARRALRPEGRLLLLEHVRSKMPVLGRCMDLGNNAAVALTGANINRDTTSNVERAGFTVLEERDLFLDIVKLIVATPA